MKIAGRSTGSCCYAYPAAFRERFGAGMQQAFRDRHRAAAARGSAAVAGLLVRTLADVVVNAFALRFIQRERVPMNWQSLLMDARYACRMFVRNPVFTLLAVGALTLGIGANTAIFTIVNGVLLRPLPYADPGRLVMVWSTNAIEQREHDVVAPLDFFDYRKAGAFTELHATYSFLAGAALTSPAGRGADSRERRDARACSRCSGERRRSAARSREQEVATAVVVSHGFWRARLGSDPARARPRAEHRQPAADDRRRHAARLRLPLQDDAGPERLQPLDRRRGLAAARSSSTATAGRPATSRSRGTRDSSRSSAA